MRGSGNTWRAMLWTWAVATALSVLCLCGRWLEPLDRALLDTASGSLRHTIKSDIAIVEIDARSLKELGTWPLPRSLHAQLIDNLSAAGASAIFLDIDFSAASAPAQDRALAESIAKASAPVILPAFWQPDSDTGTYLQLNEPIPQIKAHASLALVNLVPSSDGLVREVPDARRYPQSLIQPTWSLFAMRHDSRDLQIDYRISPESFLRLSYLDVITGAGQLDLDGRIVFVGATAIELSDMVAVPIHRALPGVVVQALAVETARRGSVSTLPPLVSAPALALWAFLCAVLLVRASWKRTPVLAMLLACIAPATSYVLLALADLAVPAASFVVAALVALTGGLLSALNVESWASWRALVRSRQRDRLLRSIVEVSSDAVLTLDAHGIVRSANAATAALLGVSPTRLIETPLGQHAEALKARIDEIKLNPDLAQAAPLTMPSGVVRFLEITLSEVPWESGLLTAATMRDVTARKTREVELEHMARHDALTGLPNRLYLAEQLGAALRDHPAARIALLMLDLDGFKEINDALGHSTGDTLMIELGKRLARLANSTRHIARIGGDEFAILWRHVERSNVEELAQQLLLVVEEPIIIRGIPISLGTSVGVALYPTHASDRETLMKCADVALYVAKRKRTHVEFYDPKIDTSTPRRVEMLAALRAAILRDELQLHYQPKVALQTGAITEVEALCRWESKVFGSVAPTEFIPIAEASEVIKPLTEWTIQRAMLQACEWLEKGVRLKVAVNLSARHLQDAQLPRRLESIIHEAGARPDWLELEITESAIMMDPDRAAKIIRNLHEMGICISIDDFGTGYSSLVYLRDLPVRRLKIDRMFVAGMDRSRSDRVIVESTIKLAHGLGLAAVAEGIETAGQYAALRSYGCDVGQGFFIARPLPSEELLRWCAQRGKFIPALESHSAPSSTRRASAN